MNSPKLISPIGEIISSAAKTHSGNSLTLINLGNLEECHISLYILKTFKLYKLIKICYIFFN